MMHINSLVSKLNLKDPWSAITHGIAMLLAIAGTAPLLLRAASGEKCAASYRGTGRFYPHYDPSIYSKHGLSFR